MFYTNGACTGEKTFATVILLWLCRFRLQLILVFRLLSFDQSTMSAGDTPNSCINTGDTTWVLVSTILVLGMMPALAFFEAGLLRSKNTLSLVTQIFGGLVVLAFMWDVSKNQIITTTTELVKLIAFA